MKVVRLLPLWVVLTACNDTIPESEPSDSERGYSDTNADDHESDVDSDDTAFRSLAWRYLYEEVDDDGADTIRDEVRALTPDELRSFAAELISLGDADPLEAQLYLGVVERSIAEGVAPFDLGLDANSYYEEVYGEYVEGVTPPPSDWFVCTKMSTTSTYEVYGASCASGCTRASSFDRQSTSSVEAGGCDFRFKFSISHVGTIDGRTTAYDNWILAYDAILFDDSGSTNYGVLGWWEKVWSGGISGNPTASYLQVQ